MLISLFVLLEPFVLFFEYVYSVFVLITCTASLLRISFKIMIYFIIINPFYACAFIFVISAFLYVGSTVAIIYFLPNALPSRLVIYPCCGTYSYEFNVDVELFLLLASFF